MFIRGVVKQGPAVLQEMQNQQGSFPCSLNLQISHVANRKIKCNIGGILWFLKKEQNILIDSDIMLITSWGLDFVKGHSHDDFAVL